MLRIRPISISKIPFLTGIINALMIGKLIHQEIICLVECDLREIYSKEERFILVL